MSRWHLLTACSIASFVCGCATSLTAGLANAPQLGGSPVNDARPHEVVANGAGACRANGSSALRGKYPPCPTYEQTRLVPATIAVHDPRSDVMVQSWVRHFYADWPCHGARPEDENVLLSLNSPPTTLCKP